MILGINALHEIKQIGSITDPNLTQVEVDRENIFGDMSDYMILNHRYVSHENGYAITPNIDYTALLMLNEMNNDNIQLKGVTNQQDLLIMETDMRVMDLEFTLEDMLEGVTFDFKSNLRGSSFDLLCRMVEEENYDSKEQMKANIQKYFDRGRISQEEYNTLMLKLFPEYEAVPLAKKTRKKKVNKDTNQE